MEREAERRPGERGWVGRGLGITDAFYVCAQDRGDVPQAWLLMRRRQVRAERVHASPGGARRLGHGQRRREYMQPS